METDRLLQPEEVAKLLCVTLAALSIMRVRKTGPAYIKIGSRVKYRASDVQAFIASKSDN